jgi:hypothetical protein
LFEVPVVRQRIRNSLAPHGLHRDAVRHAVGFIEPHSIKIETCSVAFMRLWQHINLPSIGDVADDRNRLRSNERSVSAEEGQELN